MGKAVEDEIEKRSNYGKLRYAAGLLSGYGLAWVVAGVSLGAIDGNWSYGWFVPVGVLLVLAGYVLEGK